MSPRTAFWAGVGRERKRSPILQKGVLSVSRDSQQNPRVCSLRYELRFVISIKTKSGILVCREQSKW